MADPTPIEVAARALRDADCTGHHHGTSKCPDRHCRDTRTLPRYRDRARVALVAALDSLDAGTVVVEAEYGWVGGRPVHGVDPAEHPSIPQFVGAVLRATLLAAPEFRDGT